MIWIATENGLNRFDGNKFTSYFFNPANTHSLCHNYVSYLFEDSHGRLFIGTYGGLQLYFPDTDSFSDIASYEDGKLFNQHINGIVETDDGRLIVTGHRIVELKVIGDKLIVNKVNDLNNLLGSGRMVKDSKDNIWITKRGNALYRYNPNNRTLKSYLNQNTDIKISDFCEDMNGKFYIGTQKNGLLVYNKDIDNFNYVYDNNGKLLPNGIFSLFASCNGEIYIGTDGNGLKIFNPQSRRIVDFPLNNTSLNPAKLKIHEIFQDKIGNLWLGIYQKGVLMIPPRANDFGYIGYNSYYRNVIGSNAITSVLIDSDEHCWVGTDNDGIYQLSHDLQKSKHYSPGKNENNPPSVVTKLYEDSHNRLWFGSYSQGFGWIDKRTGKCTYIELSPDKKRPMASAYDIVEDKQGHLWIATLGDGLYCYDLSTNKVKHSIQVPKDVNKWINCLCYVEPDILYVGTYRGAYKINISRDKLVAKQLFNDKIVYSICHSIDNQIWFGTSEGLVKNDISSGKFNFYTHKDGLCGNLVYSIQSDAEGKIWMGTDKGLSCLFVATGEFSNYYVNDGLQGNEFCRNSSFFDSKGQLWFGGMNGITVFSPQSIRTNMRKFNIRLCDFYLYDRIVHKGMKSGNYQISSSPAFNNKIFNLSYNDNSFSIELSTIEMDISSKHVTYYYRINNGRWISQTDGVNRISFNDMSPGKYNIEVKAQYHSSLSNTISFLVNIHPAWWASTIAWIIYCLIFLGFIALLFTQILSRYRAQQEIRRHIQEEENKEAKLQFLINISHEIRTPMTLILGPIESLLKNDSDIDKRIISYKHIQKNAKRILLLVNQLLDVRKIEKGQMNLDFKNVKIVPFINSVCDSFTQFGVGHNISLIFTHKVDDDLELWIDPANFDKILFNLLSNAFKFTPDGGKVEISIEQQNEFVEISVIDSGIGLDKGEESKVFERFYQNHTSTTSLIGTGIGLNLTSSLVKLHHGEIIAENNPEGEKGCRFIIRLPIGYSDLHQGESIYQKDNDNLDLENLNDNMYIDVIDESNLNKTNDVKLKSKSTFYVLLVEDDEEICHYLSEELSSDFHIIICKNGREALSLLLQSTQKINLVLSDIMMPEMDGITLCKKIKQNININHIPVILLTAKTRIDDNIEGLSAGADAYITKPFNIDIVRKTIENLILNRQGLRNKYLGKQEVDDMVIKPEILSHDEKLIERIIKSINKHLSESDLSVKIIADEVGISSVHLNRKLKELTNQTTSRFVRNIRLKAAAELLKDKKLSISEVSEMVGFTDANYFSTCFKELFGTFPTSYMNENSKNNI